MALVEADLGGAASLDSSSRAVFFKFDFVHLEYKRGRWKGLVVLVVLKRWPR